MKPFLTVKVLSAVMLVGSTLLSLSSLGHAQKKGEPTEKQSKEQGSGFVRIQGRDRGGPAPAPIGGADILLDLREEMRKFVQSISRFARRYKPNFIIIVQDGLELLVKRDDVDETRISPARTYMRSIDGVLAQSVFYDIKSPGKPPPPDRQRGLLSRADFARKNGIKVFTLDYGEGRTIVDSAFDQASKHGYISMVSNQPFTDIASLPSYPKQPFGENPNSIIALKQVKNFVIVSNSQPFGREDQFALTMHGNNYDMVVVDVYHGRKPLSRQAVETLKYKKMGAKRLVLAMMDLGAAASYAYYWKDNWREGVPQFINAPVREDPDRYNVEFWRPSWQRIISGDTKSYVYGLIAQGFDGTVISGVEAFKFFEGGGEEETEEGN